MGVWGSYMRPGFNEEIDSLGSKLSLEIGCPVHYPAFDKNLFECRCGVVFPLYLLRGGNWEAVRKKHTSSQLPADR